jgi:mono/diheme cytochrome c family protein
MILGLMGTLGKRLLAISACAALAVVPTACGTQRISVPKSRPQLYAGAVLFNQRCSGCHTLSYAATMGSAVNVRTAQYNNGPNFDIRCERPITRVLYAIVNGGFSGAVMPQNVVVGQQAIDVAEFVATYAGRGAPRVPGVTPCQHKPVGTIPAAVLTAGDPKGASDTTTPPATTTPANTTPRPAATTPRPAAARAKAKKKP